MMIQTHITDSRRKFGILLKIQRFIHFASKNRTPLITSANREKLKSAFRLQINAEISHHPKSC